jgi:hypothetical protein
MSKADIDSSSNTDIEEEEAHMLTDGDLNEEDQSYNANYRRLYNNVGPRSPIREAKKALGSIHTSSQRNPLDAQSHALHGVNDSRESLNQSISETKALLPKGGRFSLE